MRFQKGPVLAYAAVVLIGLLVVVQTLSPDVTALHRVPRTLSGQADYTVIPPSPRPDVSDVDTIPGTGVEKKPGRERGEAGEKATKPEAGEPAEKPADDGSAAPEPTTPAEPAPTEPTPGDPGEEPSETPMLIPAMGPMPGIMAPLIWPFVAADESKPLDEAVPLFLRQFMITASEGDGSEGDLPGSSESPGDDQSGDPDDGTVAAAEAPKTPKLGLRSPSASGDPDSSDCATESPEPSESPSPSEDETDEPSTLPAPSGDDDSTEGTSESPSASPTRKPVGEDTDDSTDDDSSDGDSGEDKTCAEPSAP